MPTDNDRLGSKLALRRHFLTRWHAGGDARVLDCCQGDGVIWRRLRGEFRVASYWGLDIKPKKGRVQIQSERLLVQPGWTQDVIDVDTYGSPWKHWLGVLANMGPAAAVFLTLGVLGPLLNNQDTAAMDAIGLRFSRRLPIGIGRRLADYITMAMLALPLRRGLRIVECMEGVEGTHARYFGIRLERMPAESREGANT